MPRRITTLLALAPLPLLLLACGDKDEDPANGGSSGGDDGDCTELTFFLDADGDGHGGDQSVDACEAPEGYVSQSTDCDDQDPDSNPDATEVCDGADNDCDGTADEDASDALSFYVDADGDGYGDDGSVVSACELTDGLAEEAGDCDDTEAAAYPGAPEVCDGVDNDCDGSSDGLAVPATYATIGEAVDAAAEGELICVEPGEYPESVQIEDKGVRIDAAGEGEVRISGAASAVATVDHAVTLNAAHGTELSGLSIAGLDVQLSDGVLLQDVALSGTDCALSTCAGQALYAYQSTIDLVDVEVSEHSVTGTSSGNQRLYGLVYLQESDLAWTGGGIAANTVTLSSTGVYGYGLLYSQDSTLSAESVAIADNIVDLDSLGTSSAVINFNGLLYASSSDLALTDVDITGNSIDAWSRLYEAGNGGSASAQSNTWMHHNGGTLSWHGGTVSDNTATNLGGSSSGGIAAQFTVDTLELVDLDVFDNEITAEAVWDGGSSFAAGFWVNSATTTWRRVDLRGNYLETGGDGHVYTYGLAIFWNGATTLENVVAAGNELTSDEDLYGLLSFNYQTQTPRVVNSTLMGNTLWSKQVKSGVIHTDRNGFEGVNLAITNNGASASDGAIGDMPAAAVLCVEGGYEYSLTHSLFWGNSGSGYDFVAGGYDVTSDIQGSEGYVYGDPLYNLDASGVEASTWDLTAGDGSPLVDAGDPDISDVDGSVSDIGAYGGPHGVW